MIVLYSESGGVHKENNLSVSRVDNRSQPLLIFYPIFDCKLEIRSPIERKILKQNLNLQL